MAETSKLTAQYRATIPATVRETLGLKKGDLLAFDIDNGEVRLRRVSPVDMAWAQAVSGILSEWDSPTDERVFRDL